jgi:amidohydrolase
MISAGDAENVIPREARARLTLRALTAGAREVLRELVREVVSGVAAAHGCTADIRVTEGAPALVNDDALVRTTSGHLAACGFSLAPTWRSCGADDFSFLGAVTRLGMAFVGIAGAPGFQTRPLHHPEFLPPDEAIRSVARAQAALYVGAAESCSGGRHNNTQSR